MDDDRLDMQTKLDLLDQCDAEDEMELAGRLEVTHDPFE
jgi:hypothetical protein